MMDFKIYVLKNHLSDMFTKAKIIPLSDQLSASKSNITSRC